MNRYTNLVWMVLSSLNRHRINEVMKPLGVRKEIMVFSMHDTQDAQEVTPWRIVSMTVGIANIHIGIVSTNQDTFTWWSNLHTMIIRTYLLGTRTPLWIC